MAQAEIDLAKSKKEQLFNTIRDNKDREFCEIIEELERPFLRYLLKENILHEIKNKEMFEKIFLFALFRAEVEGHSIIDTEFDNFELASQLNSEIIHSFITTEMTNIIIESVHFHKINFFSYLYYLSTFNNEESFKRNQPIVKKRYFLIKCIINNTCNPRNNYEEFLAKEFNDIMEVIEKIHNTKSIPTFIYVLNAIFLQYFLEKLTMDEWEILLAKETIIIHPTILHQVKINNKYYYLQDDISKKIYQDKLEQLYQSNLKKFNEKAAYYHKKYLKYKLKYLFK